MVWLYQICHDLAAVWETDQNIEITKIFVKYQYFRTDIFTYIDKQKDF